jgi:hypothetical protein
MKRPLPQPRLSTLLAACAALLALLIPGGWLFAMAHYNDDRPDQVWQFDLGMDLVLYAFLLALIVGAAAVWARLFGR